MFRWSRKMDAVKKILWKRCVNQMPPVNLEIMHEPYNYILRVFAIILITTFYTPIDPRHCSRWVGLQKHFMMLLVPARSIQIGQRRTTEKVLPYNVWADMGMLWPYLVRGFPLSQNLLSY